MNLTKRQARSMSCRIEQIKQDLKNAMYVGVFDKLPTEPFKTPEEADAYIKKAIELHHSTWVVGMLNVIQAELEPFI